MSKERAMGITAHEIPRIRKEIPKEGTYNLYGGDARKVEIQVLADIGAFTRVPQRGSPRGEVCIKGWQVCWRRET